MNIRRRRRDELIEVALDGFDALPHSTQIEMMTNAPKAYFALVRLSAMRVVERETNEAIERRALT